MSPLLEVNITGARGILFNVTGGSDLGLFEVNEAAEVIKEAADAEANIIFGTVIDDRMRDEVKVTVIATGFDPAKKSKAPNRFTADAAGGVESALDDRSREILAEIERDREQRATLEEQMGEESPFARPSEREATEIRPAERQPLPVRPAGLERPSYSETDLDIPSFLRRKND
jgi:cell division protein FtsZ